MTNGALALPRRIPTVAAAAGESSRAWYLQLSFLAVHVPIAFLIAKHSKLGTIHALVVFALGLIGALVPRRPEFVTCAAAYITGGAVYWRMRAAPFLPWEFGKYAVVILFTVALVLSTKVRRPTLPVTYFVLLLPSAYLTLSSALPADQVKRELSFNLSGPLALAASVLFFSSVRLSAAQFRWAMTCLIAPVVSVAVVAAQSLERALADPEFEFYGGSSNPATSGGFGPNQVSAVLGLGMLAIVLYLIAGRPGRFATGLMLLLLLFLIRQCLITLSRGGMYMAVGAVGAASAFLVKDARLRKRLAAGLVLVVVVVILVVIPRLEAITGGVLVSRFQDTAGTGREELVRGDMDSWASSPVIGVGPGLGGANRLKYFGVPTAHTEYTRLVAEHGLFGLTSLVLLGLIALRAIREPKSDRARAIAIAFVTYALLFMAVDAMRLVAPAFALGIACTAIGGGKKAASRPLPVGRR